MPCNINHEREKRRHAIALAKFTINPAIKIAGLTWRKDAPPSAIADVSPCPSRDSAQYRRWTRARNQQVRTTCLIAGLQANV